MNDASGIPSATPRDRVPPPPAVRLARRLPAASALVVSLLLASAAVTALHMRATMARWIDQGLPEDALLVAPARVTIGPIALGSAAVPLSLYEELGRDPRVHAIALEEALTVPARVHGSLAGRSYGSDVAVLGIDAAALAWLAPEIEIDDFQDADPLPVLAPRILLDAYNGAFAPSQGLPRLAAGAFTGRTFTLEPGASSLGSSPAGSRPITARLIGFAGRGELLGVLAPIAWVRRMNAELDGTEARRLVLFPASPADAESLTRGLREKGYDVSEPAERSRQLARLDILLLAFFLATAIALGALAAVSAASASAALILARRDEAELLHQLAEPRGAIIRHFAFQLAIPVLLGATLGASVGSSITLVVLPAVTATWAAESGIAAVHAAAAAPRSGLFAACALAALTPVVASLAGGMAAGRILIPRWRNRR